MSTGLNFFELILDPSQILGALIAGVIGIIAGIVTAYFTARYEDLNRRRKEHLKEHVRNMDLIKKGASEALGEIFPPWKSGFDGSGTPWLGKYGVINRKDMDQIIKSETARVSTFRFSGVTVIYQSSDGLKNILMQDSPDAALIDDSKVHFPEVSEKINEYEQIIRTEGSKLLYDFYMLSDGIYDELDKSGYKSASLAGNPVNSKDDLPALTIARAVFNKALDIPEAYWPNTFRIYDGWRVSYQTYLNELDDISNHFHDQDISKEIRELINRIKGKERELNNEIDKTMHFLALPKRCIYLK